MEDRQRVQLSSFSGALVFRTSRRNVGRTIQNCETPCPNKGPRLCLLPGSQSSADLSSNDHPDSTETFGWTPVEGQLAEAERLERSQPFGLAALAEPSCTIEARFRKKVWYGPLVGQPGFRC
jgi:hypothetical protein